MKRGMIVIALAAIVGFMPAVAFAQKLVFVVRHTERADAALPSQTDPGLSVAGEAPAQKLAAMLGDAGVKYIFATKRTQDTAKPLAMKAGVAVTSCSSSVTRTRCLRLSKRACDGNDDAHSLLMA
jgi:broad specificity phosphatase PhoE